MVEIKKVVWDKEAAFQLKDIYKYLKKESVQSADKVRVTIINEVKRII
ncbi:hypothetical protein [Mariniflexile sp.]